MVELASVEGVAFVERLDGVRADPRATPRLLVEVPHGADRRAHFDALRSRLVGDLPDELHVFFHVNTDIGAWDYGRRVAERVLEARPEESALLVRSSIPRTFVDVNRLEDAADQVATGGMTAGVAPYVRDADDLALLLSLHRSYVALAEQAYAWVCGAGGLALCPHTYGPRTMGIPKIDDSIVAALRAAHEPEAWASWPVRAEVDLITRTPDGTNFAPEGMPERLIAAYGALGLETIVGGAYTLHPSTQTYRFSTRHPGQVLCLEVRRDLLVEEYTPFDEMVVRAEAVDRIAAPLADAFVDALEAKDQSSARR